MVRVLTLVLLAPLFLPAQAAEPVLPDFGKLKEETIQKWSGADLLVLGQISNVIPGPVGLSQPPLYTYRLQILPGKILRGEAQPGQFLTAGFSIRQQNEPAFPAAEKECLIALKYIRNAWVCQQYAEAAPELIAQAQLAASLPLGWTVKEGKLLSPWASVGKPGKGQGAVCAVTGRPALLAGAVRFEAEPIPPGVLMKFKNPDGDGEYLLRVKNETKKELTVPALLTDGKVIHWNDSVVLRCQGKTYPIPGAMSDLTGLKPVILKPGEEVTGKVNAFVMDGPAWPRGGSRIEFQFCLGEKSATHSFYYFSSHHDPIREAVQKGLKK